MSRISLLRTPQLQRSPLARARAATLVATGAMVAAALLTASSAGATKAGNDAPPSKKAEAAEEQPDDPVLGAERPTRAPGHADCDHRVPLWTHVVMPGENLGAIAGRYGVRRKDIVALNPTTIADENLIRVGDGLKICPEIFPRVVERKSHVIAPGETLTSIAARYDLEVEALVAMQPGGIPDPDRVHPGHMLRLELDAGLVEDFRPPPPKPKKKRAKGKNKQGGKKSTGRGRVSVQLAEDPRVYRKRPRLAYGTAKTIGLLSDVVAKYRKRHARAPKVLIGDISKRGGGKLDPHLSHRNGRDVDVGYVLQGKDAKRTRFSGVTLDNLDVPRTWSLLKSFLDTGEVQYIFLDYTLQKALYDHAKSRGASDETLDELFQYPRGRGRSHGIIRHWRSHRNHFHVRFRR